ncbi:MAG: PrsW family intramembrane metalloprotease [Oscillospiraceae bacterium]|nr:PrsW family intramembrane metalloprotease [Oscillospiraceae bacterium]
MLFAISKYFHILLAAALIPPIAMLLLVNHFDKAEHEPTSMLMGLYVRGVVAMFPILILERLFQGVISLGSWGYYAYLFLAYFCLPGFIEEGVKYQVLKKATWYHPEFDFTFDAVVYAVFVSLGFASVENVLYVMSSGLGAAISRAIFAIPGHTIFGIFMGVGYGRAKLLELQGWAGEARRARRRAYLVSATVHGLYDFVLVGFGGAFYVYFAVIAILGWRKLKRASRDDVPLYSYSH